MNAATRLSTAEQVASFIGALFPDPAAIVEVRLIDRHTDRDAIQYWWPAGQFASPENIARLVRHNADGFDVYIGINARPSVGATGNACIESARCVFIDADKGATVENTLARIEQQGLPRPTIINNSGHGVWCFWLLSESITPETFTGTQKDLAKPLGTDPKVCNTERVGRVPGFTNHKEPRAESVLIECDPSRVYELCDIVDHLPLHDDAEPAPVVSEEQIASMAQKQRRKSTALRNGSGSVIEAFNDATDIEQTLLSHGYSRTRRPGYLYRPGKTAGGYSVIIREGQSFHFSTEDVLNDGQFGDGSVGVHDAFDVWRLLQHRGEMKSAVRGAAKLLGIEHKPKKTQQTSAPAQDHHEEAAAPFTFSGMTIGSLIDACPELRPVVIEGLLRRGETMNVISAPKIGKSWLVLGLALALVTGRNWLNLFNVEPCKVLVVDNELHPETLARRVARVAESMNIPREAYADRLVVQTLRGQLRDWYQLRSYFASIPKGEFGVIICDAFYRFQPRETDENDNGSMASIYNQIDAYADMTGAAFVLIHHTSKGIQAAKAITDVGAGAGAQSRATDTHLVLRHHEEPDVVVLDAAVRSFKPIEATCLRWEYPLWHPAPQFDPEALRKDGRSRRRATEEPALPPKPKAEPWTVERFVATFLKPEPTNKATINVAAQIEKLSGRRAADLLLAAIAAGQAFEWIGSDGRSKAYSTIQQPVTAVVE